MIGPRVHIRVKLVVEIAVGACGSPQRPKSHEDSAEDRHDYDDDSSNRLIAMTTRDLGGDPRTHLKYAAAPRSVEHGAPGAPVRRTQAHPPPP